jgi:hypothetical protein
MDWLKAELAGGKRMVGVILGAAEKGGKFSVGTVYRAMKATINSEARIVETVDAEGRKWWTLTA